MDKNIELQPVYVRISQHEGESVVEEDFSECSESFYVPPPPEPPKQTRRCSCMKFLLCLVFFWLFCAGIATIILGFTIHTQVHKCLHPVHHREQNFSYRPCQLKSLDLNVVAGSIEIRSCPHAKNITIHIREGAHSSKLLEQMEVQSSFEDGILRIGAFGPSFDFHHCQLSHISITIPHHARPNLHAHVISGHISVRGSRFNNLKLTTSLGYIETHKLKVHNELDIQLFTGILSSHETTSNISNFQVENGFIELHNGFFNETNVEVGLGGIKTRFVNSKDNIEMSAAIGGICAELGDSKRISSHVDYGFLRLKPADASYFFRTSSKWGIVDVLSSGMEQPKFEEASGMKSGFFGEPKGASEIDVSTTYARAQLVFHRSSKMYDSQE